MKDIPGYEGLYAVTNCGKVWSYGGRNGTAKQGKFLSLVSDKDGYKKVTLKKRGEQKTFRVSRLVLSAFKPANSRKLQVNHINGCRYDDRVDNLEWVTPSQNIKHSFEFLNRNQKCTNNNAFKKWGYVNDSSYTIITKISVDTWCRNNNIASTTIYTSMKENRELKKGRFCGYRFFRLEDEFGSTGKNKLDLDSAELEI